MAGVLLLSHCGFSFMENLAAAVRARGLRVLVLTSRPADDTPGRLAQLRELADAVLDVPDRHELVEQDVARALEALRSRGEKVVACLSVWEGYRALMARANAGLDVQDLAVGVVELLADKLRVRQALQAAGLTRVRAEPVTDDALRAWLHEARPGFVKPRRGIASFGAQRLRPGLTAAGLAGLIEGSRSDPVYGSLIGQSAFFIEDHVSGPEFSFEVLAFQGRAHLVTVHEKLELTETDTAVLEDSCASPPPGWSRAQHDEASAWVAALLAALGAGWGCFHIEARRTVQGWELIEANPRAGGALISQSSAAQHGGRSLLDQWLDLLLDQHGTAAERLSDGLAAQAGHYPNDRATFFRVFFAKPGLVTAIRRNEMTRTPDSLQCFLEPGSTVPASDREVFAGQALWSFERQQSAAAVAHLLVESRQALEIDYGSDTEVYLPASEARDDARRWLLILDYNLTRRDEVQRLRRDAAERHGLSTVLVRARPTAEDQRLCDAVLDLDPLSPAFVDEAEAVFARWPGTLVAGVVFSDNAVASGARLLRRLHLRVDDPLLAEGAFSKAVYREAERRHVALMDAQGIDAPAARRLSNVQQAIEFVREHPGGAVLKPACEGNNRGVVVVHAVDEVERAWAEVSPYLAGGIVAEAFITHRREYSCDGVGHLMFFTEKLSATGSHPVELGQLVPARLSTRERATLERGGRLANLLVGQSEGPFHNEIRLSDDGLRAAVVEPNRRPAGMKIWKLAERVYGLSLYACWIDAAVGELRVTQLPAPRGQAAVAMLGVQADSRVDLARLPPHEVLMPQLLASVPSVPGLEWFDFDWLPQQAEYLAQPRDNAGFLASVCFHTPDSAFDLVAWVDRFRQAWAQAIAGAKPAAVQPGASSARGEPADVAVAWARPASAHRQPTLP